MKLGSRLVPLVAAGASTFVIACAAAPRDPMPGVVAVDAVPLPAPGAVFFDEGPRTWAARPTTSEITPNDLRTRLYAIADDSMNGREVGSPGNAAATAHIAREFERLGLRPAGENGTFFQALPYGVVGQERGAARMQAGGAALAVGTDWVPGPVGLAPGTGGSAQLANVPTVFGGAYGDTVAFDPAVVGGKVVVLTARVPAPAAVPLCDTLPDRFGANAAAAFEARQRAARASAPAAPPRPAAPADTRAQAAGARAVLLVAGDALTAQQRGAAFAERGVMGPTTVAAVPVPTATITRAAAARLFGGTPVASVRPGTAGAPVTAAWRYSHRPADPATARNVIAILPGSDPARASEYVLVGAHNDHEGALGTPLDHDSLRIANMVTRRQGANDPVCRPSADQQRRIDSMLARARSIRPARPDSIMNGADDDGSGTVVLLEVAERFAARRPARSLVFISHQGEEAGLLGSLWFAGHPTIPLNQVVAAINMDMVGKGRASQVKFGGPNSVQLLGARRVSREFGDIIDSVNAVSEMPMAIDRSWEVPSNPLNRFCRSDQVAYVQKGIPTVYMSTGYTYDYHQATDEPQYIDYQHTARLARFVHDVMKGVAERPTRPSLAQADTTLPNCRR